MVGFFLDFIYLFSRLLGTYIQLQIGKSPAWMLVPEAPQGRCQPAAVDLNTEHSFTCMHATLSTCALCTSSFRILPPAVLQENEACKVNLVTQDST